jgi:hypothetical protein
MKSFKLEDINDKQNEIKTTAETIIRLEEQLNIKAFKNDNYTFWNKPDKLDKEDIKDLNNLILEHKIIIKKQIEQLHTIRGF